MTSRLHYLVIPAVAEDLEVARAGGAEILYRGDTAGVADFFGELTCGVSYAVLSSPAADRREQTRAFLLVSEGKVAQVEALLLAARALYPAELANREIDFGEDDFDLDLETITTLDHCLYDILPKLRGRIQQIAFPREPAEAQEPPGHPG